MLTILTPTYNRLHTLPALYDSLRAQASREFEWLVVDDGSTDGTAQWLRARQDEETAFPIRVLAQPNGGKHAALNAGAAAAQGDWIFIVDSDDRLTVDAVECVRAALADAEASAGVAGVCFRKARLDGGLLGRPWSGPSPLTARPSWVGRQVQGDLAYVFQTPVMRSLPFPLIPGEKFVPELYIWNRIADAGDIRYYLDRAIYLCEYLPDGYTRNFRSQLKSNPGGFLLFYADQIHREPRWRDRLKALIRSLQCLAYCAAKARSSQEKNF